MIRLNDVHSIPLIARVAGVNYVASSDTCVAHYDDNDKLTSGILYSNSNNYSSEMHVASFRPHWATKELLWFVFFYAFRVRQWEKIFGRVPETNIKALRLDAHLGFKQEAYFRDVFGPHKGLYVFSMYKKECRFLNMKPPKVTFPENSETIIVPSDPLLSYEVH